MDIKSINEYTKFDTEIDLYDLSTPSFIYRSDISLNTYTVKREEEMRIDLIFKNMYGLEPNEVGIYLENIDVILYINNIDNPLNIKSGISILYPAMEDLTKFRYDLNQLEESKYSKKEKIIFPNKSTKKDKNRESFKANKYSLPPVVLDEPRPPVRIKDGRFSVGGL